MVAFTPPRNPDAPLDIEPTPRIRIAEFGDGYSQRGADGINHLPRRLSLKWSRLSWAQGETINNFFMERGGFKPFTYQPPGLSQTIQFICPKWKLSIGDTSATVTAQFVEVFDL